MKGASSFEEASSKKEQAQFLANACDSTRLLAKRRELFDIKERLAKEKEEYNKRCQRTSDIEADLSKRDLEFQEKLVRFKLFTKENESEKEKLARR